jgi:nicotinate phosphoribosyltransferase
VRLDSGDLIQLAFEVRRLLDEAGVPNAKIVASGDLNEFKIAEMTKANAPIDVFGVGTDLVRSRDNPALPGVYKLVYDHTEDRPVAKFSQGKASLPGIHQVFRRIRSGRAEADIIGLPEEFHVDATPLLVQWMAEGKLVRALPSLSKIRAVCRHEIDHLPDPLLQLEIERADERYPVLMSDALKALVERVRGRQAGKGSRPLTVDS